MVLLLWKSKVMLLKIKIEIIRCVEEFEIFEKEIVVKFKKDC